MALRALKTVIRAPLGLHLSRDPCPAGPGFPSRLSFLSFFASQAVSGTVAERRTIRRTTNHISRCLAIRVLHKLLVPAGKVQSSLHLIMYTLHRRSPPTVPLLHRCPLKLKLQELATVSSARPQYLQARSALSAGLRQAVFQSSWTRTLFWTRMADRPLF